MWTEDELKKKKTIEECAYKELTRNLESWWNDQENRRGKNKNHNMEPFLIWIKKNKI